MRHVWRGVTYFTLLVPTILFLGYCFSCVKYPIVTSKFPRTYKLVCYSGNTTYFEKESTNRIDRLSNGSFEISEKNKTTRVSGNCVLTINESNWSIYHTIRKCPTEPYHQEASYNHILENTKYLALTPLTKCNLSHEHMRKDRLSK